MRYELYLRAAKPASDLASRILEDLEADPDVGAGDDGEREYSGEDGVVGVILHPEGDPRWEGNEVEEQSLLGVDLSIAGGAGEGLAALLTERAFAWAKRWTLDVYDPQLGRTVDKDDPEAIIARVKRHSEYLTDTVGLGEQSTRYMDVDVATAGMSMRTKFYLGLVGLLLVLGLVAHFCG